MLSKADVIQATGDAICIFRELQCLTPRGRYDIRIYPTFLHLHGKTFDYKIPYTTVLRLFLLPHKDQRQMFFVVSGSGSALPREGSGGGSGAFVPSPPPRFPDQPGPPDKARPDPLPLPDPALLQGRGHLPDPQHERVSSPAATPPPRPLPGS